MTSRPISENPAGLLGMSGKTAKTIQGARSAFLTTQTKEYISKQYGNSNKLPKQLKIERTPEKLAVEYVGEAFGKTPKTARAKSDNNIAEMNKAISPVRFVSSPIKG